MITRISSICFAIALVFFMTASTANAYTDANTGYPADNVTNSKHNLGTGSIDGAWNSSTTGAGNGTNEVCVFCHTPHGANTDDAHGAPLWNKALTNATEYKLHAMAMTMTGSTGQGTPIMEMMMGDDGSGDDEFALVSMGSIACLSCHDGSQALDSMINGPGSGWGAGDGTSAITQGYTFSEGSLVGNALGGSGRASNLSKDLRDDHPVSVKFSDGACTSGMEMGDVTSSCDQNDDWGFRGAVPGAYDGWNVLDADSNTTPIYIYARHAEDFEEGTSGRVGSVECGSCHNPHRETTGSTAGGDDSLFLRMGDNVGSRTCLVCHIK